MRGGAYVLGHRQTTAHGGFYGGLIVGDAGLLAMPALGQELGVLYELAWCLPDPLAQRFITHARETLLIQQVC